LLFLTLLACVPNDPDGGLEPSGSSETFDRLEIVTVRVCAVIASDSPAAPSRLIFLHRTDLGHVDAQAELTAFPAGGGDASRFRCDDVELGLIPGRDGTSVLFDHMPREPVVISEMRMYRSDEPWAPENPHAVALEDHRPFRDYVFHANLVMDHPTDPSTLLVRTTP